jgi:hypothetical protein
LNSYLLVKLCSFPFSILSLPCKICYQIRVQIFPSTLFITIVNWQENSVCMGTNKRKKKEKGETISYFFTIEKMMICVPVAVCSSSATFAVIEIAPNPKSIPVFTVTDFPAGISTVPLTVLLIFPKMPPST